MNTIRAAIRLILIIALTFFMFIGLLVAVLVKGKDMRMGYAFARNWAKWCCKIIGLKVEVLGDIPKGNCIITPNHRSYSDIFASLAQIGCSFVAKAEVRKWPLLGIAAAYAGTIFVNRSSLESRKNTLVEMEERLSKGFAITIFPEGTTFSGPGIKDLKPGTFRLAVEGKFMIIPAAIEYKYPSDAWVGKDLFLPHFIRTFGRASTHMKIRYGTPILPEDTEQVLTYTHEWILKTVQELREEYDATLTIEE